MSQSSFKKRVETLRGLVARSSKIHNAPDYGDGIQKHSGSRNPQATSLSADWMNPLMQETLDAPQ